MQVMSGIRKTGGVEEVSRKRGAAGFFDYQSNAK
jgi:hypothetical protein